MQRLRRYAVLQLIQSLLDVAVQFGKGLALNDVIYFAQVRRNRIVAGKGVQSALIENHV
ncbi:hypothetical protein D3C81_2256060 [compost metagenome]